MKEKMKNLISVKKSTNKNYRWSIRKLSTGAASIVVGASIMFGSSIPAFASLNNTDAHNSTISTASTDTAQTTENGIQDNLDENQKTTSEVAENELTNEEKNITDNPINDNSLMDSSNNDTDSLMQPMADPVETTVTTEASNPVDPKMDATITIEAPANGKDILINTSNAKTVKAEFVDPGMADTAKRPITLIGNNGVYTYPRPSTGGKIIVTATGENGKEVIKDLVIAASVTDGIITPVDPTLNLVNDLPVDGITDPSSKDSESAVRNASTEFYSMTDTGTIRLKSTSWTQGLSTGWGQNKDMPFEGKYVLTFQDPKFYENIDSISVNNVKFTKAENGSIWYVILNNNTFGTGQVGSTAERYIDITMKTSKSLDDPSYGINGKPITFGSQWITGKDYDRGINDKPNYIVAESIDNGWFSTSMENFENAKKENGAVNNPFTGTGTGKTAPSLKAIPVVGADGLATAIKLVYQYRPNLDPDLAILGSNSHYTIPYVQQVLPEALLPYIDQNNVYIYQSNATGGDAVGLPINNNINGEKFKVNLDSNIFDTRDNDLLTVSDTTNPSRDEVENTRKLVVDNLLHIELAGQIAYFTVEYNLANNINSVELAKQLNKTIIESGNMLTFEGWMGRELPDNVSPNGESGARVPGILENSYANAFLDTNLLLINAPLTSTIDFLYPETTLKAGEISQAILPSLVDIQGKAITVPPGTTFATTTNLNGLSNISINKNSGAITVTAAKDAVPGKVTVPVSVNYSDGSSDIVFANINIITDPTDTDNNTPIVVPISTEVGAPTPDPKDGIDNEDTFPEGTEIVWTNPPDTSTPGPKIGEITITYPDGSTDVVDVPVEVKEIANLTDAEKNNPIGKLINVNLNDDVIAEDGVTSGNEDGSPLPAGTTYEWVTKPDTSTTGYKTGEVKVTYPDKSSEIVTVPVLVGTLKDKYDPQAKDIETVVGTVPSPKNGIVDADILPAGTGYSWSVLPDVSKAGETTGTVAVLYPDNTVDYVEVKVTVKDKDMNEVFTPVTEPINVEVDGTTDPKDGISNWETFPEGTDIVWTTAPNTSEVGETSGVALITYPDQTTTEVTIPVNVKEKLTDADNNNPTAEVIVTPLGTVPPARNGISNLLDLPENTNVTWKEGEEPVVTATGTTQGTAIVTYPDNSFEYVTIPVVVIEKTAQNITFDPQGQDINTTIGILPVAKNGIKDADALPEGTTFVWVTAPDVSSEGTKTGIIAVIYPDKTVDYVETNVNVTKTPEKPLADSYDPTVGSLEVNWGTTINEPQITDLVTLPEAAGETNIEVTGTMPDTHQAGNYKVEVTVTYSDGSTDVVEVPVKVKERPENEQYPAYGDTLTVKKGTEITNADIEGKVKIYDRPSTAVLQVISPLPDTDIIGETKVKVLITYADKTTNTVEVTVNVVETDADAYTPVVETIIVPVGGTITEEKVKDSVTVPGAPEDTKIEVTGTLPDTKVPGDYTVEVTVTYPDETKDVVEVPVKVTEDKKADNDKYEPVVKPIEVKTGDTITKDDVKNSVTVPGAPEDTKIEVTGSLPDTKVPGDYTVDVTVTYPDGTKDVVEVPVKVTDEKKDDNEVYEPIVKPIEVKTGDTVTKDDVKDSVTVPNAPEGTKIEVTGTIPDTKVPGDHTVEVTVTYPDGTKDVVKVPVKVTKEDKISYKYTPVAKPVYVSVGDNLPDAEDTIKNLSDLPKGTMVVWNFEPKTDTPGEKSGSVRVIYPDGSEDIVLVTVIVESKDSTQPEKTRPIAAPIFVEEGGKLPSAEDVIINRDKLPEGTEIEWVVLPDTSKAGETTGVIKVTYPDGTSELITVKVTVKSAGTETPGEGTETPETPGEGTETPGTPGEKPSQPAPAPSGTSKSSLPQTGAEAAGLGSLGLGILGVGLSMVKGFFKKKESDVE